MVIRSALVDAGMIRISVECGIWDSSSCNTSDVLCSLVGGRILGMRKVNKKASRREAFDDERFKKNNKHTHTQTYFLKKNFALSRIMHTYVCISFT